MGAKMNRVLDGVKIGRIYLQPQWVTSWRCGLLPNYLGHIIIIVIIINYCAVQIAVSRTGDTGSC